MKHPHQTERPHRGAARVLASGLKSHGTKTTKIKTGVVVKTNVGIAMPFAPSPIHHHVYGWYKLSKMTVVYDIAIPTLYKKCHEGYEGQLDLGAAKKNHAKNHTTG